jgi:hypothetical protein
MYLTANYILYLQQGFLNDKKEIDKTHLYMFDNVLVRLCILLKSYEACIQTYTNLYNVSVIQIL